MHNKNGIYALYVLTLLQFLYGELLFQQFVWGLNLIRLNTLLYYAY